MSFPSQKTFFLLSVLLSCSPAAWGRETKPALRNSPVLVPVTLTDTLSPSALVDLAEGKQVHIAGRFTSPNVTSVLVRVTSSLGVSSQSVVPARDGAFRADYPAAFPGAPELKPCVLFIDATEDADFDVFRPGHFQAEAALLVRDTHSGQIPDLPTAFMSDLRDARGNVDRDSAKWPFVRKSVNLYLRSQAARYCHVARAGFDLDRPADLEWFKNNLTLYEFDYRDRDWSSPLGARVARTFFQSVWDTWFNPSNCHPEDNNPNNRSPSNYTPYAFSNDFADSLIAFLMRQSPDLRALDDNLATICREGTQNLLSMQHRGSENFALKDHNGKRETYTAGAFRYGLFENGEFLTEGKGWFYNPAFNDYVSGGVLNGRCIWGLGEALRYAPSVPLAEQIKESLALGIQFCLRDAQPLGYAKKTSGGNVLWRDVGEHAYLTLGLVAACAASPELQVTHPRDGTVAPLRAVCVQSLNALADAVQPHGQWSVYPNVDSVAIAALADGADRFPSLPDAVRWRATAVKVADAWMACTIDAAETKNSPVHFGLRVKPDRMTFNWRVLSPQCPDYVSIHFYLTGHWMHALSRLYAVTGDARYRDRALAMVRYLCGDNPWHVRLFNELGGVYNWVDDMDGDGVEDYLKQDQYPESTAFCQIGIFHLMRAMNMNPISLTKESHDL
jgi:hypothetical protein